MHTVFHLVLDVRHTMEAALAHLVPRQCLTDYCQSSMQPAPGSANWLSKPNNQIQSPPAAAIAQSAMLGQYETGKIALDLDNFLKGSAEKLEAQAALGRLVRNMF